MLDHRRQIVQFRLPTQPNEMIAIRHDGGEVYGSRCSVPAIARLPVTEALCFHLFGPEKAFGGVGFASGSLGALTREIPR